MGLFRIIVSALLLSNLIYSRERLEVSQKTTNYPVYTHQVINLLKKHVEKEYGLRCYGRGGSMPYDVMSLTVDFQSKEEVTIERARELVVPICEKFLKIVNSHEDIRPFLREYPVPVNRLTLTINFKELPNEDFADRIECVFVAKG